ncbi:MAG: HAD family phosphatase [Alistipes sp.]|nr:HAD family phosphatase [Alistipes sp.]
MVKGIIFDLDGTLIDSMQVWYDVDRRFLGENGVSDPPEDISDRVKKMTIDQSSELFIREFGLSCTKEYVIRRIEELVRLEYEENIPLKPFAAELLEFLDSRDIPCGVATVTYDSLAEAVLGRCGIREGFKFLLTDKDFPGGKNSPDIYIRAAELLGTKPEDTLVIEDSLHCVETAKKAGFITAAVYDRAAAADRAAMERLADFYIMTLDEVKNLL